jgi:hypothetical protein
MNDADQDIADLLDGAPGPSAGGPTRRPLGRPKGSKSKPKPPPHPPLPTPLTRRVEAALDRLTSVARHDADVGAPSMDMTDVFGGVTVGWLSKVFGMDPSDVKKRLADCPPLHRRKAGYVYSLPVAARYLVKPVFDAKKYLENMKPSELPTQLQKDFWSAQLARQKWEENAGHLWRTEAVIDVLGETFKTIKFTMQLWSDSVERVTGLTAEQKVLITQMVDGLQDDIYKSLVEDAKGRTTGSLLSEGVMGRDEQDDVNELL